MVADRKVYFVSPKSSDWVVTTNGRTLSKHSTKADALTEGRKVAKGQEPSQLRVMKTDGSIEFEHTYGDDPNPPKG